jgi:hypothetical protein
MDAYRQRLSRLSDASEPAQNQRNDLVNIVSDQKAPVIVFIEAVAEARHARPWRTRASRTRFSARAPVRRL